MASKGNLQGERRDEQNQNINGMLELIPSLSFLRGTFRLLSPRATFPNFGNDLR